MKASYSEPNNSQKALSENKNTYYKHKLFI